MFTIFKTKYITVKYCHRLPHPPLVQVEPPQFSNLEGADRCEQYGGWTFSSSVQPGQRQYRSEGGKWIWKPKCSTYGITFTSESAVHDSYKVLGSSLSQGQDTANQLLASWQARKMLVAALHWYRNEGTRPKFNPILCSSDLPNYNDFLLPFFLIIQLLLTQNPLQESLGHLPLKKKHITTMSIHTCRMLSLI